MELFLISLLFILPAVALAIGIAFIVYGIITLRKKLRFKEKVMARCVEIHKQARGREGIAFFYCPVYEYMYEGQVFRVSTGKFKAVCNDVEGGGRELRIDPKHPEEFRTAKPQLFMGIFWIWFGSMFFVAGIIVFVSFLLTMLGGL